MIENKKYLTDAYSVQKFHGIFQPYVWVLTVLAILLILSNFALWRTHGMLERMLKPFLSILAIVVTISAMIFIPYIFYILKIEKKKNWIIALFLLCTSFSFCFYSCAKSDIF